MTTLPDYKVFPTAEEAARAWAKARGISGKQGQQYLVVRDVVGTVNGKEIVKTTTWRPWLTNHRAVRGYCELAQALLDRHQMSEVIGGYQVIV